MTESYKKLAQSVDEQSKNLRSFIDERGDNITAEDLAEARRIKGDIAEMRTKMKSIEEAEGLKGFADDARAFLDAPAQRHAHSGGNGGERGGSVLGAKKAGTVFLKPDGSPKRNKALQFVREAGPHAFKPHAFEAASQVEYRDAFRAWFRGRPHSAQFRLLEDGLDAQGGYLAPVEVIAKLIQRKPAPTSVASYCNTINTGRDRVTLPRVNYSGAAADDADGSIYTTGVRVTMTDENPTSDTQSQVNDTNMFGSASVDIYTWMLEDSLTNNVIEDAMFDPLQWLAGKFAETIDLHKEKLCIKGWPGTTVVGLLTRPGGTDTNSFPPVINTGLAAAPFIQPDSLINLTEDLPTQYDSNVRYLYRRRTTGKAIRTFKDAQGRYLFGDGVQDSGLTQGRRQVLNDYPVSWSDFMPDPAANAYPVVAGDFGGVTIVNRIGFSVQVLREVAARRNQVIIIGRVRLGVAILEPWKLRVLACQ